MKALITGASGFIGSSLVEHLCQQGVDVFTLGRSKVLGSIKHYELTIPWNRDEFVDVVTDVQPDYFFHLAGSSQITELQQAFSINTCLGADILDAIRLSGLQEKTRCLLFGSAAEYGLVKESELPITEQVCCQPINHYGLSKLAQTHYVNAWLNSGGRAIIVRPFTVLGKGMPTSMAIASFAEQIQTIAKKGGKGTLFTGNIDVCRDFVDVSDVVNICWELIRQDQAMGKTVNICSNQPLALRTLVDYMIELLQVDISVKTDKGRLRKFDMSIHYGDNKELIRLIGAYKFTSWQSSVKHMLDIS